jgi:hypothetical protein
MPTTGNSLIVHCLAARRGCGDLVEVLSQVDQVAGEDLPTLLDVVYDLAQAVRLIESSLARGIGRVINAADPIEDADLAAHLVQLEIRLHAAIHRPLREQGQCLAATTKFVEKVVELSPDLVIPVHQ